MEVSVTLLGFLGLLLFLGGVVLLLAGARIIQVRQYVAISPGGKSLLTGVVFVLVGAALLVPDIQATISPEEATSTPVAMQHTPTTMSSDVTPVATLNPTAVSTATVQSNEGRGETISDVIVYTVEVNVSKSSANYGGEVDLIVDKIELLANGRMRWHISFWNHTDNYASLAFGEDKSYVSDEEGNQYEILAMEPSEFIDSGVPAGVRLRGWLEFNSPQGDTRNFQLHMRRWTYGSQQLSYENPLEITLDSPLSGE
jgi:hypothetical protein